MNGRLRIVMAVMAAMVLSGLFFAATADDDGGRATTGGPIVPGSAPVPGAPSGGPCAAAPPAVVTALAKGLTVSGGGRLTNAKVLQTGVFQRTSVLVAEIDGPGIDGPGQVGVWSTTDRLSPRSHFISANSLARQFSRWPATIDPKDLAAVAAADATAEVLQARACLG